MAHPDVTAAAGARPVISLLLECEYPLVARGIRQTLAAEDDMRLLNDDVSQPALRDHGNAAHCDVVLMNPPVAAADPLVAVQGVLERVVPARVVVLTADFSEESALELFRIGARGVLPLTVAPLEIVSAVRHVVHGGLYVVPELQELFAAEHLRGPAHQSSRALSLRETQVLRLVALGHTHEEIGAALSIGVKTVDTHRANVLRKLELRNNADLTRHAIRTRLIRAE
jgi:DNA-binding NarL/FixJ family response regulator